MVERIISNGKIVLLFFNSKINEIFCPNLYNTVLCSKIYSKKHMIFYNNLLYNIFKMLQNIIPQ